MRKTTGFMSNGERILEMGLASRDLYVLWAGSARVVAEAVDGRTLHVAELVSGDVFGLLGRSEGWPRPPHVKAITDCEVVIVDQTIAQEVTSHNPALAAVLNQVRNTRRRRLDRMMESASEQIALASARGDDLVIATESDEE